MCNAWAKYGECKNGDSCTYAHTHEALELARQRQLAKAQKKVSSPIDSLQFLHGSQPRLKPAKVSRFMNVFWHAADKSWGYDFGTGELLAGAALVHHDDKCHLLATSILKGLNCWFYLENEHLILQRKIY